MKARHRADLWIAHFWLVDPEARQPECFRAEAGTYQRVLEAVGDQVVERPDWPSLRITLGDLWA